MTLTLWLVRHGETGANAERTFQGHLDVPLNERGEEQARAVGRYLERQSFDAIFASDLSRAARTAELIAGSRQEIILDPRLREMHYGLLQGVRYDEAVQVLTPHGLADAWMRGEMHRPGVRIPGGETSRRFRGRSSSFVRDLDAAYLGPEDDGEHHVLIVAHGGKLAVLMTVLLGLPMRSRMAFRFANCAVTKVTRERDRSSLDLHNLIVWDETIPLGQSDRLPDPGESGLPHR
jgi:broad specificity phosphatase PhoE